VGVFADGFMAPAADATVMIVYQTRPDTRTLWIQIGVSGEGNPSGGVRWDFAGYSRFVMRSR
jgi:hypothetical protein